MKFIYDEKKIRDILVWLNSLEWEGDPKENGVEFSFSKALMARLAIHEGFLIGIMDKGANSLDDWIITKKGYDLIHEEDEFALTEKGKAVVKEKKNQ